jgi:hypothetical protein
VQKITLQPMTPAEIVQAEKERLATHVADTTTENQQVIQLKIMLCLQPKLIFLILMLLLCVMPSYAKMLCSPLMI